MTQTADVIIIGAGVIGAATAFELAKAGCIQSIGAVVDDVGIGRLGRWRLGI